MIATDHQDAKAYAALLERITGEKPTVVLSDDKGASERIEAFAAVYARVLAARPEVLDLLSAQAAVLERNVSTEAVGRDVTARL